MDKKVAVIFPGQGAQYIGMGKDFYETFSIARETFDEAGDLLGLNLSKLIFAGPADELRLTKNSQIAIYVMSIALWRVLKQELPEANPFVASGLSLGEYSALTASGRLNFEDGVRLVRARGEYMHEAGIKFPGTMIVVLGMKPEDVLAIIDPIEGVCIANLNCPGQVVVSGGIEGIKKASVFLKKGGAKRILPLEVSGAFHSELMEEAKERLKNEIGKVSLEASSISLVMNVTGDFVSEGEIRENMIKQVVSPVYWEKGVRKIEARGGELFLEVGPGKTLYGMNRKIKVSAPTLNIEKVEDLDFLNQGLANDVT